MTGIGFAEDFLLVDSSEGRDQLIPVYIIPIPPRGQADVTYPLVLKGKSWQFPFLSQLFQQEVRWLRSLLSVGAGAAASLLPVSEASEAVAE